MLAAVIWFLSSAVTVDMIGYWLHRWAHRPSSPLHRPHMTHHLVAYPPKAFTSQRYRGSGTDSLVIWFAPFGAVYLLLVLALALPAWPIAIGGGLVALLNSVLHDRMHTKGSTVRRWFPRMTEHHRIHHSKMGTSFGILSSAWDRLFGTAWVPAASRARRRPWHRRSR